MKNLKIAIIITKRFAIENIIYMIMFCVALTTSLKLIEHIETYTNYKKNILTFKSDLILPKGNQIEQINSLLNVDTKSEKDFNDYIPYALYTTLENDHRVQFEDGQNYQSAQQQSLLLAPFLFLDSDAGLVLATEENFYKISSLSPMNEFPTDDSASISLDVAQQKKLKIGDLITIQTNLNSNLTETGVISLKIKYIRTQHDSPWDKLTIVSLRFILEHLKNTHSAPQMIWKNQIINGILVDSSHSLTQDNRNNLDSLVNKRTIAVYSHSDKLIESAFRIMGYSSEKEAQQNYLIILLAIIGLLTLGYFHSKNIFMIKKHLILSLYENSDANMILLLSLLIATLPAIGLSWIFLCV